MTCTCSDHEGAFVPSAFCPIHGINAFDFDALEAELATEAADKPLRDRAQDAWDAYERDKTNAILLCAADLVEEIFGVPVSAAKNVVVDVPDLTGTASATFEIDGISFQVQMSETQDPKLMARSRTGLVWVPIESLTQLGWKLHKGELRVEPPAA